MTKHRITAGTLRARPPMPAAFLYCTKCGARYSPTAGDYFWADDAHVFRCCRRNMLLVTEQHVLTEVAA